MKKRALIILTVIVEMALAVSAKAVCPVCVVAVGAGLGLSRWMGVDDVISSIWIGGLLWGLGVWTVVWLRKKNWGLRFDNWVVMAGYYLLVLGPLYYIDIMGHPLNKIFGMDKILFGTIIGTVVFVAGTRLHEFLKTKNSGKSFFVYQKVVVPISALAIISLLFYFLLPWI